VTAMDAVKNANRQPGVLNRNVGEGMIMLHGRLFKARNPFSAEGEKTGF
jgi:hypothetical protein